MNFNIYERDPVKRVASGKVREAQIADALRDQIGLDIRDATENQDKFCKIDRWLFQNGNRIPLQIKFRTKGDDLLFEVYDTFLDWTLPDATYGKPGTFNKLGRDMQGDAKMYAVLLANKDRQGKHQVVIVNTDDAKRFIWKMVDIAEKDGWTTNGYTKTLRLAKYHDDSQGVNPIAELKLQHDPGDGRPKMVAYVPPQLFNHEIKLITLPERWAA